jgi:hypothetical protein
MIEDAKEVKVILDPAEAFRILDEENKRLEAENKALREQPACTACGFVHPKNEACEIRLVSADSYKCRCEENRVLREENKALREAVENVATRLDTAISYDPGRVYSSDAGDMVRVLRKALGKGGE